MKNRTTKALAASLSLLLAVMPLSGCHATGGKPAQNGSASGGSSASATSKPVQLSIYFVSDPSTNAGDNTQFLDKLNQLTKKDLNATVKTTFSTWTDFSTKYNLVLTSGQQYDLIYSASWLNYAQYAQKGAFMDLTGLVTKYCPAIEKTMPQSSWDGAKVDGKIYGVPSEHSAYENRAFLYRNDLRKKYGLPEINSVATIQAYLEGIKKNDPAIMPTNDRSSKAYDNMFIPTTKYQVVDLGDCNTSNFVIDPSDPTKVLATVELPEYKPFMNLMKQWADEGFWSKSALSSNDDGTTSVVNGKAAATFDGAFPNSVGSIQSAEKQHPDWDLQLFEYDKISGVDYPDPVQQNLFCITRSAANPERALMLLDKLETDQTYYMLTQYGIEGLNYNLTGGKLDYTKIDTKLHGFGSFPAWSCQNDSLTPQTLNPWPEYDSMMAADQKISKIRVLNGFNLDTTVVQSQYSAINQVKTQYGIPLQAGLVSSVDTAYNTFLSQSKAAGLDTCLTAIQNQVDSFLSKK